MTNEQVESDLKVRRDDILRNRLNKLLLEIATQEIERDVQLAKINQSEQDLSELATAKTEAFEKSLKSMRSEVDIVVGLINAKS